MHVCTLVMKKIMLYCIVINSPGPFVVVKSKTF